MNSKMIAALALAIPLVFVGLASAWLQFRGLRELQARKLVPSDESAYLRGRHRRRFVVGALLVVIGGMIAGAFLSGMEARADELGEKKPLDDNGDRKKVMTDEERRFIWRWGAYWMGVMALTFALIGLAIADGLASRRYWLKLFREMRDEHNNQLRRDLAVYMQQKEQGRGGGFGGRLGGGR